MTTLDLVIERAVPGGRMLARHDGRIVLVSNAIPGERVRATIERQTRSVLFARATEILEPSPARREVTFDAACGGQDYAHIEYDTQLRCKSELVADAFRRQARMNVDAPAVRPSPIEGYRLRARLHVRHGRVGFFREGTHDLCDAGATRQLHSESLAAVDTVIKDVRAQGHDVTGVTVSENVAATERVVHLEFAGAAMTEPLPPVIGEQARVTGVTTLSRGSLIRLSGSDHVTDTSAQLFQDDPPFAASAVWHRRSTSFFQGNRYLVGDLVRLVLAAADAEHVTDLYSGVGLFAVALAAMGAQVTAVEGDASAAADLERNAAPWPMLHVVHGAVERAVISLGDTRPEVVVLDPPRSGASADALEGILRLGARRLVYVSCDPPTLARDAARLARDGYLLKTLDAFDLFPNTAHVESIAVFERH